MSQKLCPVLHPGDSILSAQLKEMLDHSNKGELDLVTQGNDDDFSPIAKAIDNLMEKMGWIK